MNRLEALLQIQALDRMPRTGWCQHEVPDPETVAGHSFGTAVLALALAPDVDPPLDADRAVSLALIHDVAEAHLGDIPHSARPHLGVDVKRAAEASATEALLGPLSPLAAERGREALGHDTREARFVHLCDTLQLGLRLLGYVRRGIGGLDTFRAGLERLDCDGFAPCAALRDELLEALDAAGPSPSSSAPSSSGAP